MATTFPDAIQTFPTMQDITRSDAPYVMQYQTAMQNGDIETATQILQNIQDYGKKIVTADLLNTVNDTVVALQKLYAERYNPSYIVSETQPSGQKAGDYWFQIIEEL